MQRKRHIEERPWWPNALRRFEQLAEAGEDRHVSARRVSEEFEVGLTTIRAAMMRGSVPCFPSTDPKRAAAWAAGEQRYQGKLCKKHGTRIRYTNDGACIECMVEYSARRDEKMQRDKIPSRGAE